MCNVEKLQRITVEKAADLLAYKELGLSPGHRTDEVAQRKM
jgi:hypothetical protein